MPCFLARTVVPAFAFVSLLGGCAPPEGTPASQRGFFSGLGAMASGQDVRNVQALQTTARERELQAGVAALQAGAAQADADRTSRQVAAAEQRLAVLDRQLTAQQAELRRLRANGVPNEQLAPVEAQWNEIRRAQRAATQPGGDSTPAALRALEQRAAETQNRIGRFGAL